MHLKHPEPEDEDSPCQALDRGLFTVRYQPQLEFASGRLVAAEALLRWEHPRRGLLLPSHFLGELGAAGRLGDVCLHVLRDVEHHPVVADRIAINTGAEELCDPVVFPRIVERLVQNPGLASRLVFELTEHCPVRSVRRLADHACRLIDLGVEISLDDFGIGCSSLEIVHALPLTEIKVDRSFVLDAARSRCSRIIVESIARLGRDLGLRTVAEGVEEPELLRLVEELGCSGAQGHTIAPPMPPQEAAALVESYDRREVV